MALLCAILFFAVGIQAQTIRTVTTETVDESLPGSLLYEIQQLQNGDVLTFDRTKVDTIKVSEMETPPIITKSVTILGNGVTLKCISTVQHYTSSMTLRSASFRIENVHFEMQLIVSESDCRVINCIFKPASYQSASLICTASATKTVYLDGCAFLTDGDETPWVNIIASNSNYTTNVYFTSCTFVNDATNRQSLVKSKVTNNQTKKFVTFVNCVLLDRNATDAVPSVSLYNIQTKGFNVFQGVMKPLSGGPAWEPLVTDAIIALDATEEPLTYDEGIYKVTVDGAAYLRLPANPQGTIATLADVTFPEKDLSGNDVDYRNPVHSGAWQDVYGDEGDGGGEVVVTDVMVNFPDDRILFTDTTWYFTAAVFSQDGNATQEVTWECDDSRLVVTPSETDKLSASFRAEDLTEDANITITVKAKENGADGELFVKEYLITLKPYVHVSSITLPNLSIPFGYERGLRATVRPANANWKEVEWTVANSAVASITVHGDSVTLKGLSEGTTTVTVQAKDGKLMANNSATITVSRPNYYANGVFIVNEDWWGHRSGSVNFLYYDDGRIDYQAFYHANSLVLGTPAQYGAIYGGKFYIVSKDGLRLAVSDARTLELQKGFLAPGGLGLFFFGVDEQTGYVGTSNGLRVVKLNELPDVPGDYRPNETKPVDPRIVKVLPGTDLSALQSSGSVRTEQVTTMKRVGNRVFALQQGLLHIIDATTHQVQMTLRDYIYIAMTQSKDGYIWLGTSGTVPSGDAWNPMEEGNDDMLTDGELTNYFIRLDPWTLEQKMVALPGGVTGPGSVYGAWQADAFQGSAHENVIYWKSGHQSISRYNIATNRVDTVLDLSDMPLLPGAPSWTLYGTSFAIDHLTGEMVVTTGTFNIGCCVNARNNWKILRVNPNGGQPRADGQGVIGNILAEYPLEKNYWFPAIPVFPDTHEPEFTDVAFPETIALSGAHPTDSLDLISRVADEDNMRASIVTTVLDGYDKALINAFIWRDTVVVAARTIPLPGQPPKTTTLTLKFNSNGHVITKEIPVTVEASQSTSPIVVHVESVTLDRTTAELTVGQTLQLNATVAPDNADNKTLTWASSQSLIASVDQNGLVTAHLAPATVSITAATVDGSITATCTVTTKAEGVTENPFELTQQTLTLDVGQTAQLNITVPEHYTVTWRSLNEDVAIVSASGKVVALGAGTTKIIAEDLVKGKSDECTVTVREKQVEYIVSLNHTLLVMNEGDRMSVTATVSPFTDEVVTWSSSNPAVADVTTSGTVIAFDGGNAIITAQLAGGAFATCNITVRDVPAEAEITDIGTDKATLLFPRFSGMAYYLVHLFEVSEGVRQPVVACKMSPDGTIIDIIRLRSTSSVRLVFEELKSSTQYEVDIDVVRDISGVAETVSVLHVSFTTLSPTGVENVFDTRTNVWYANGMLRMENLDGYTCTVMSMSGQHTHLFRVVLPDESRRIQLYRGVYILSAQKDGERKVFKFIVF
jgi:uncharacterized protein YjdB